jgi:hypothetical protein
MEGCPYVDDAFQTTPQISRDRVQEGAARRRRVANRWRQSCRGTTNSTADPEKNTHPHLATSLNRNGAAASDGGAYGWGVARRVSDATDGTFQGTRTVTNRRNIASK